MNDHVLASSRDTVTWGRLPARSFTPVVEVSSGDRISIDTLSHEGLLEDQGRDPAAFFSAFGVAADGVLPDAVAIARDGDHDALVDGPHIVTGPIAVTGAQPGDVVEVEFLALDRRVDYGIVSNRHGLGALPGELPEAGEDGAVPEAVFRFATAHGATGPDDRAVRRDGALPPRPLPRPGRGRRRRRGPTELGAAGEPRREPRHPPPRGRRRRLFLPVQVDGAGFYVGDPHFAQGDGEVALTAFEAPLRATLRITLHREAAAGVDGSARRGCRALDRPRSPRGPGRSGADRHPPRPALLAPLGFDRATALAYLGAAADLHVSQVVDRVKGSTSGSTGPIWPMTGHFPPDDSIESISSRIPCQIR